MWPSCLFHRSGWKVVVIVVGAAREGQRSHSLLLGSFSHSTAGQRFEETIKEVSKQSRGETRRGDSEMTRMFVVGGEGWLGWGGFQGATAVTRAVG